MLYLALSEDQFTATQKIGFFSSCPQWQCSIPEWQELVDAGYCYCDDTVYRAHEVYSTPDFQMSAPDSNGVSSEAGDQYFEDTRQHLYDSGKLQI